MTPLLAIVLRLTLFSVLLVLAVWYASRLLPSWGAILAWLLVTTAYVALEMQDANRVGTDATRPVGAEYLPYRYSFAILVGVVALGATALYTMYWQQAQQRPLTLGLVTRGVLIAYLGLLALILPSIAYVLLGLPH